MRTSFWSTRRRASCLFLMPHVRWKMCKKLLSAHSRWEREREKEKNFESFPICSRMPLLWLERRERKVHRNENFLLPVCRVWEIHNSTVFYDSLSPSLHAAYWVNLPCCFWRFFFIHFCTIDHLLQQLRASSASNAYLNHQLGKFTIAFTQQRPSEHWCECG